MSRIGRYSLIAATYRAALVTAVGVGLLVGNVALAEDKLSKFLLIKLSREQSQVLCESKEFTACMGFTQDTCLELSEKALEQCIVPLPDTISLAELNNDQLEACPKKVYEEAGFSDDKAVTCIQDLLKE